MVNKKQYWFIFQNDQLLVSKTVNEVSLLTAANFAQFNFHLIRQYQFFDSEELSFYCAELPIDFFIPPSLDKLPFRQALEALSNDWYQAATRAYTIINWDKNHQFCGRCGSITTLKTGLFERFCQSCQLTFYPRISPSIIVRITKGPHLLLARSHHFKPGVFGLIAGFVEGGENLESAIHREIYEEVGLTVNNVQYFGSQAWPFPDSLMIAFTAEYAGGELTIDTNEIAEANWYHYNQLPGRPSKLSISSQLIDDFIARAKEKLL